MYRKIFWFALLAAASILSACDRPAPTAETQAKPTTAPTEGTTAILSENLQALSAVETLQPIQEAAVCKWAADSLSFWVAGLSDVHLYGAETFEVIASYEGNEYYAIYDVSPDGRTIAFSLDGLAISLFDLRVESEQLTITPDFQFSGAFFSPDGSSIGVESLEVLEVVVYDTASGKETDRLSGFETAAPVYGARYGADGETLMWVSRGTVQPMDIASGELMPALQHEDFVSAFALSPDGSTTATAAAGTFDGEFTPQVTLWDAMSGEALAVQPNTAYFSALAFSPDSSLLAAGTENGVIFYASPSSEQLLQLDAGAVSSLSFSPDGNSLLTCRLDGSVTIWKPK